jgi:membrane-associated phospholipid phosphatase
MKTEQKNIISYLIVVLIQTLLYEASGFLNSAPFQKLRSFEPSFLTDQLIPYIPQTIWTYSLYYLVLLFGFLLAWDRELFPQFLKSFILLSVVADAFFVFFPVTISTPSIHGLQLDQATIALFNFIIPLDTRGNCFPSLHCAHSLLITYWFAKSAKISKWLVSIFSISTILVIISTLTLKKHWLVDVLGAFLLTSLVIANSGRKLLLRIS